MVHRFEDAPSSLRQAILRRAGAERLAAGHAVPRAGLPGAAAGAARGAGGHAPRPRGRPHGHHAGRPGPAHPADLRALVHQGGAALAPDGDGPDPAPLRPPAPARPRLHGRGRGAQARLQQGEDAPDASSRGLRGDRRRAARLALAGRRAGHRHPPLLQPAASGRRHDSRVSWWWTTSRRSRRTVERALKAMGYEVLSVVDPSCAYELLESGDFDLVLLDVHMPQMSGDALFLALVRRCPELATRVDSDDWRPVGQGRLAHRAAALSVARQAVHAGRTRP